MPYGEAAQLPERLIAHLRTLCNVTTVLVKAALSQQPTYNLHVPVFKAIIGIVRT